MHKDGTKPTGVTGVPYGDQIKADEATTSPTGAAAGAPLPGAALKGGEAGGTAVNRAAACEDGTMGITGGADAVDLTVVPHGKPRVRVRRLRVTIEEP